MGEPLNVNGLQQKTKRIKIFNYVKEKVFKGIVMLQETHSSIKDVKQWENEWDGDILQNHGTSNSRGVLIAFTKDFEKKILKYERDENGRIQVLSFEYNKECYLLVNIYNPNTESEQVKTLKQIDTILQKFDNIHEHNIIIGGDWNFILDKDLDARGGNPLLKLKSIAELTKLKNMYELCDIFRIRNLTKRRFTFNKPNTSLARRLDYFLVSETLQVKVIKCDILTSLASDHSPIYISISTKNSNFKKGSNYWKFNNSLLKNEGFCSSLKRMIDEKLNEYNDLDAQIKWELIKYEIRKHTIKFSKNVAKEKRERKSLHENIVNKYETMGEPHSITGEQYQNSKNELERFYNDLTEGYILRSKCKWYEEGEKSTQIFLGLEKKGYSGNNKNSY